MEEGVERKLNDTKRKQAEGSEGTPFYQGTDSKIFSQGIQYKTMRPLFIT
jgi:hypothetical protein